MQPSTTNFTTFNDQSDQMTSCQDWREDILQCTGSLFDTGPMLPQETTINNFDHFEKEVDEILTQVALNDPPGSDMSEALPHTPFPWVHRAVMQEGGTNPSTPTASVRVNRTGRRLTLSDPTHTRPAPSQRRITSIGSHRSLRSRGTWSSLPTLVDIHHRDQSDPNWLSEMLNEPAASIFDDAESTLGARSVGEDGL